MDNTNQISFPVGYHKFHEDTTMNFEFNRWISVGMARFEDFKEVASRIKNYEDWRREMISLAEKAISENRLKNAAIYYRAAEFFTWPSNPKKMEYYDNFIKYFNLAFRDEKIMRHTVSYEGSFLPAFELKSEKNKGNIVIHGGLDSFIEEFYYLGAYFVNAGYNVIMFEGPGQGAALRKYNLTMHQQWERPTRAVLDYFKLHDITLIGISLGGLLCLRAAAYEPRIKRVISLGVAYDYLWNTGLIGRFFMKIFMNPKYKDFINRSAEKKIKKDLQHEWSINQTMHISGKDNAYDALIEFMKYSVADVSHLVKQDVLLLHGKDDHFVPVKAYYKQKKVLTNAKSVTGRLFTKEEHAQNHCQIGNMGLALDVMSKWIDERTYT